MALDTRLLSRAKQRLENKKRENEAALERRRDQVYAKFPKIAALDQRLKASVIEAVGLTLRGGDDMAEHIGRIRDENLLLQEERVQALLAAGLSPDYLDNSTACRYCGDTGYVDRVLCVCLQQLYEEEQRASLSSLFKLGNETFDNFDLTWYDDTPDPVKSARDKMAIVYEACLDYARKFERQRTNLYLSGGTGLGKTYLSACIARVVAGKGFSVVYDTAAAIFARYEEEKFDKGTDLAAVREALRRYSDCDLLIMDDLGTEMTTAFTISALYELVNTRLTRGKKTIINSNLSAGELYSRYSPQIGSRIAGEYDVLNFCGKDIRILKKDM